MNGKTGANRGGFTRAATGALDWWRTLQPDDKRPRPQDRGGDRANLARLRRASNLAEAMAEEATIHLWRRMAPGDFDCLPRVAVVAHVLAHVRRVNNLHNGTVETIMRLVGRPSFNADDKAKLKPIRFRRLLALRENDELMREMRRLVLLADHGRLDVGHLAASLLFWDDDTRARWAFDYFAASHAIPDASAGADVDAA